MGTVFGGRWLLDVHKYSFEIPQLAKLVKNMVVGGSENAKLTLGLFLYQESTSAGNVSERHVSPEAEETGLVHVSETTF